MTFRKPLLKAIMLLPLAITVTGCEEEDEKKEHVPAFISNIQCRDIVANSGMIKEGESYFCYSPVEPTSNDKIDFVTFADNESCLAEKGMYEEDKMYTNSRCLVAGNTGVSKGKITTEQCRLEEEHTLPNSIYYCKSVSDPLSGSEVFTASFAFGGNTSEATAMSKCMLALSEDSSNFKSTVCIESNKEEEVEPETNDKPYQAVIDELVNRGVPESYVVDVCEDENFSCTMNEFNNNGIAQSEITYKDNDHTGLSVELKLYPLYQRFFIQQTHNVYPYQHHVVSNNQHKSYMNMFNGVSSLDKEQTTFVRMLNPDSTGYKITTQSHGSYNGHSLTLDNDMIHTQKLLVKTPEGDSTVLIDTKYSFDVGNNDEGSVVKKKAISILRKLLDGVDL